MKKNDWKRYKKEEKKVIINIDYEDDRITIYTNNSTVGCNLYRRLGHSDTSITMDIYNNVFEETKSLCAKKFEEMFKE